MPNKLVPEGFAAEPNPNPVVPKLGAEVVAVPKPPKILLPLVLGALLKFPNKLLDAVDVVLDPKEPNPYK